MVHVHSFSSQPYLITGGCNFSNRIFTDLNTATAAGAHGIHAHLRSEGPEEDQFREGRQGHQDIDVVQGNLHTLHKAINQIVDISSGGAIKINNDLW